MTWTVNLGNNYPRFQFHSSSSSFQASAESAWAACCNPPSDESTDYNADTAHFRINHFMIFQRSQLSTKQQPSFTVSSSTFCDNLSLPSCMPYLQQPHGLLLPTSFSTLHERFMPSTIRPFINKTLSPRRAPAYKNSQTHPSRHQSVSYKKK